MSTQPLPADKYPPVELTEDYAERLAALPVRATWAKEDEPYLRIPEGAGYRLLSHGEALRAGVVRVKR